MPRLTLKATFVVAAATVALFQLLAVTFAALPPNMYSRAAAPHTDYLRPMFTQNWRLFAPNPVSEDRNLRFQGSYVTSNGIRKQTDWVDWTEVELDLIRHRLIGGRAGYVSNKLFSPLGTTYRALLPGQRQVADRVSEAEPLSWAELSNRLLDAGPDRPRSISTFLRYERATARLATEVLQARWPDRTFVAVRYSLVRHGVTPYAERQGSASERDAARPSPSETTSGWRVPDMGNAAERHSIADFDRRHR